MGSFGSKLKADLAQFEDVNEEVVENDTVNETVEDSAITEDIKQSEEAAIGVPTLDEETKEDIEVKEAIAKSSAKEDTKAIEKEKETALEERKDMNNTTLTPTELWEFLKKWDSFTVDEQEEIIGDKNLLIDYTPEEAIKVVADWEESKRVHIGDVIEANGVKGICIGINIPNPKKKDTTGYLVTNGSEHPIFFDAEDTVKTDKSIDIGALL